MNRIRNIFEFKPIVFTIFIIIVVVITGGLLYKKLALISNKLIEPTSLNEPVSLLSRQIILDLRVAENNARSFQLTHDANYITLLYYSSSDLEQNITALKRIGKAQQINRTLIDSFANLSHLRLELIKTQSSVSDPSKVAEELNAINSKIEETYPSIITAKHNSVTTNIEPIKKKKGLIKRLFNKDGKKENNINTERESKKNETTVNLSDTKNQLKSEVLKVKAKQIKKLEDYKKNEYEFNKASVAINEKLTYIAEEFKRIENHKSKQAALKAQMDINGVKKNAIIFSIILSIFLFMLAYLIVSFIRKKQQYETALIESKIHSDELAKTKELFLANMSHEIKTPLNAIYGFTEQLLSSDLNTEQKSQLNIVKNSAEYLSKLVTDILTYSKLQSGKIKIEINNFNLSNVLFEIEALFKVQAQNKNITFNIDNSQIVQNYISTDIYKLKQILFNIIGNAIKFTSKGHVHVSLLQQQKDEKNYLNFLIVDTGIGIEEEKMKKLFNEYEQGDSKTFQKYGGSGLGLVITKQLIEQLGGSIEIESEYKVETKVYLNIPYEIAKKTEREESTPTELIFEHSHKLKNKLILIADDEEFNRLLLKSILKKHSVVLFEAENGEEAVQIAKKTNLDIIVMDIRMPVKNGIDATKEIREFNKDIPIIASTAVLSEEKITRCLNAGVTSIVFKPFKEIDLLNALVFEQSKNDKKGLKSDSKKESSIVNFDSINEFVSGDELFKKEMILTFRNSLDNGIRNMQKALLNKEYLTICEIAHKIIPACKHFEASELVEILKKIENKRSEKTYNEKEIRDSIIIFENHSKIVIAKIDEYIQK